MRRLLYCSLTGKLKETRLVAHYNFREVDCNIISWNRVILLHGGYTHMSVFPLSYIVYHAGPPGTGKTSLCKALAQKLCIRFSDR